MTETHHCLLWGDPATHFGFAVGGSGHVVHGEFDLSRSKHDAWCMSAVRLKAYLDKLHQDIGFTIVGYEKANFHVSLDATELRASLVTAIQEWCVSKGIPFTAAGPGTIKKHFTGNGRASKQDMIDEARRRQHMVDTDNEADAVAGWYWLREQVEAKPRAVEATARPLARGPPRRKAKTLAALLVALGMVTAVAAAPQNFVASVWECCEEEDA